MMPKATRLKITDLNPQLTCVLCNGYYVDATTIIECLHSFCRSCIVKYLETSKFCPICDVQVHKTKPLMSIRSDKTLQDIVYKLVPGLFKGEMKRRRDYYSSNPTAVSSTMSSLEDRGVQAERFIYTPDEDVSLSLEYWTTESQSLPNGDASKLVPAEEIPDAPEKTHKRYLQSPAAVTIAHLKKLIRNKYELPSIYQVDIIHQSDVLCDHYSLVDVAYIYSWRRNGPMRFFFKFEEPEPYPPAKRQKTCNEEPAPSEVVPEVIAPVAPPVAPKEAPCVVTSSTLTKVGEEPPAPKKNECKAPVEKPVTPEVSASPLPMIAPKRRPEGTASITITPITTVLPNGVSDKGSDKAAPHLPPSPVSTPEPPTHGMVITKVTVEAPPPQPRAKEAPSIPLSLPVSLPLASAMPPGHPGQAISVSVSLTPSPSPPVSAAAPSPKAARPPKENGDVFVTTIVPITTKEPKAAKEQPPREPDAAKDSVVLVVVASKEPPEIPATNGSHSGGPVSPSPPLHLPVPDISITPIPPRAAPRPASISTSSPQVEIIKKAVPCSDATTPTPVSSASATAATTTTIISTSSTDTTTTITITSTPVQETGATAEDEETPKHDNFGALDLSRGSRCMVSLKPLTKKTPTPLKALAPSPVTVPPKPATVSSKPVTVSPKPAPSPHPSLKTTIRAPQAHSRLPVAQSRHALNVPTRSSHLPVSTVQLARPTMKAMSRIANGFVQRAYPQQQQQQQQLAQPAQHHHHHHHHHSPNRPKQILSPTGMMAVKYRCLGGLEKVTAGFNNYHNGEKVDSSSVNM